MHVPFAFVTAYDRRLLGTEFLNVPWLSKPLSQEAVTQTLHYLLARTTRTP